MQAMRRLNEALGAGAHLKVAFANAHVVNLAARDEPFRAALGRFMVLPDGVGVDIGSRLLHGAPFPDNLNGTDFTPAFLAQVGRPLRVALVGARPGVAEKAAERLRELAPRHAFVVVSHGFFDRRGEVAILDRLRGERPDVLLVAFGNPRQEAWIAEMIGRQHCSLAFGVGALFDFLAGEAPRAPALMRRLRLEWLFRLSLEPSRLWRRYVLGNPAFLARMALQRLRGRP
jgi:exopolysaccharide biosynthesis WecB/TagA/CpsF family protein